MAAKRWVSALEQDGECLCHLWLKLSEARSWFLGLEVTRSLVLWGVAVSQASGQPSTVSQWELILGARWSGSLTVRTWYWPSCLSDDPPPPHSLALYKSGHTRNPSLQRSEKLKFCWDWNFIFFCSANWLTATLDGTFILWGLVRSPPSASSAAPPSRGRHCWLAMFLVLVVTPELREFLARARCGAVRLLKVCIREGEWASGGEGKVGGWVETGSIKHKNNDLVIIKDGLKLCEPEQVSDLRNWQTGKKKWKAKWASCSKHPSLYILFFFWWFIPTSHSIIEL